GLKRVGGEFQINRGTVAAPAHGINGDQSSPDVAALSNGDFIVAFQSVNESFGDTDIYAQQFNSAGAPDDVQRDVANFSPNQITPAIAATTSGYVTVWEGG